MRRYDEKSLLGLRNSKDILKENGLEILLKKTPELNYPGHLDPSEKAVMLKNWVSGKNEDSEMMKENTDLEEGKNPYFDPSMSNQEIAEFMRDNMGFANISLNTEEIITKYEDIPCEGRKFGLWRYYKRRGKKENRPCLIYYHGGAWIGGSVYTVENPCKLIAELSDSVVFNVDYALAPEEKFPKGFNDCYEALIHVYNNAEKYGIDKEKIVVAGDSAGGQFATAVALRARNEGLSIIAAQILLYPGICMAKESAEGYEWKADQYTISDEEKDMITPCLFMGETASYNDDPLASCYLEDLEEVKNPYVSPWMEKDFSNLPKTVVFTAEFDGLRLQGELYAKKMLDAGIDVNVIRYCGATHAYLDRLGFVPQSEDNCIEIANILKSI